MDGIHARFDSAKNKLFLYWGESKAHQSLSTALGSALDSIKEFIDNKQDSREIEIVSEFADIDSFSNETKSAFLNYFDPYAETSNERITVYSCLLVHTLETDISAKGDVSFQEYYEGLIKSNVSQFMETVNERIKNKKLDGERFEIFILPVPSVQDFRDKFQQEIGL